MCSHYGTGVLLHELENLVSVNVPIAWVVIQNNVPMIVNLSSFLDKYGVSGVSEGGLGGGIGSGMCDWIGEHVGSGTLRWISCEIGGRVSVRI